MQLMRVPWSPSATHESFSNEVSLEGSGSPLPSVEIANTFFFLRAPQLLGRFLTQGDRRGFTARTQQDPSGQKQIKIVKLEHLWERDDDGCHVVGSKNIEKYLGTSKKASIDQT